DCRKPGSHHTRARPSMQKKCFNCGYAQRKQKPYDADGESAKTPDCAKPLGNQFKNSQYKDQRNCAQQNKCSQRHASQRTITRSITELANQITACDGSCCYLIDADAGRHKYNRGCQPQKKFSIASIHLMPPVALG